MVQVEISRTPPYTGGSLTVYEGGFESFGGSVWPGYRWGMNEEIIPERCEYCLRKANYRQAMCDGCGAAL